MACFSLVEDAEQSDTGERGTHRRPDGVKRAPRQRKNSVNRRPGCGERSVDRARGVDAVPAAGDSEEGSWRE